MKENKNVKGCRGCSACPGNLEEYGVAQMNPTKYCPDAYSDRAQYCGNYDNTEIDVKEDRPELYNRDIDKAVYDKACELEKKEEEKEPEFVTGEQ